MLTQVFYSFFYAVAFTEATKNVPLYLRRIFIPLQSRNELNTLPNVYKLCHFNLTISPLYLVKLKITQKQPTDYAVRSVEPINNNNNSNNNNKIYKINKIKKLKVDLCVCV